MKRMRGFVFLLAALVTCAGAHAAEPTRVYLANDDHTDYVWTADPDTYARVFIEMLDWHLQLADTTAGNPPPFRNRFNADGSLWLSTYEQRKSPAEFERLVARIKDGTISVPLNTLVSCYGGQPVEAALRGLYYAGRIERRYDLRFPLAIAMENQTLPRGLASLFAGAGARYSWRGVCGCASKLPNRVLGQRPQEVYWWTGPDGQRLLLKWYSLGAHGVGGYWEAGSPVQALQLLANNQGIRARHVDPVTGEPYRVFGLFGFGGDDLARKTGVTPPPTIPARPGIPKLISSPYCDHFFDIARQQSTPERQVIVSNEIDYFEDFERTHGANLPKRSVTFGNEWDLYSASLSETSARVKRAVEKLRSAELLATLVSLQYRPFMERHTAARDRAFTALGLYWEHNWTADGPISREQRAAWEEQLVATIEYYVNSVQAEGLLRLGGMIPKPADTQRFFVLNPLGWVRTDAADFPYRGSSDIHVRDLATGKPTPHQIATVRGARVLRIWARDIPAAGYKVFQIVPGAADTPPEPVAAERVGEDALQTSAVRVAIARDGAIRSLIDRRHGDVELAGTVDGLRLNDLAPNSDDGLALEVENSGPVSVTIRARSSAGLEHSTAITLYRESDRVDVRNEIWANFSDVRHWAFSCNVTAPAVRTEEVGAINLNALESAGGAYAETHARYDYITVNHFADVAAGDDTRGLTISNADLAFARLGRSTITELDVKTPQLNLLAGGQVDGRSLGIRDQNGASYFLQRFALRPHAKYDAVAAMRFALEHQNPLIAAPVIGAPTGACDEVKSSLLSVSDPGVLVWAVKPAEEGIDRGVVVRLWNVSDSPKTARLELTPGPTSAVRATHIETDIERVDLDGGAVPLRFAPQQIQTYRLELPVRAGSQP